MATGVWLIGARGSVAVTSMVGALALRAGLAEPVGCVCELPQLRGPALPGLSELVFGGHDVVTTPLSKKAEALAAAGVLPGRLVTALTDELHAVEDDLRPVPEGDRQAEVAAAMEADLAAFRDRHRLDRVVVVNVASTEPAAAPHPAHDDLAALVEA
ncbi:inositol-3-phosphate synthase, partial [Micromonospora zhanjiangensis]